MAPLEDRVLRVDTKVHDVAVFDDVLLALGTQLAGGLGGGALIPTVGFN